MPLHPYADSTFERIFAAPPSHPIGSVSVTDENGELRRRLIAERVLVPAPPAVPLAAKRPIAMPADTATFFATAKQIIATGTIAHAREIADGADTDERLRVALRSILALPPQTRDQIVQRASRKKAAE